MILEMAVLQVKPGRAAEFQDAFWTAVRTTLCRTDVNPAKACGARSHARIAPTTTPVHIRRVPRNMTRESPLNRQ